MSNKTEEILEEKINDLVERMIEITSEHERVGGDRHGEAEIYFDDNDKTRQELKESITEWLSSSFLFIWKCSLKRGV